MMYVSHACGEGRIYDFYYDPSYIVPCKSDAIKASKLARSITAPLKILPNYDKMFSDLPIEERQINFARELLKSEESIKNKFISKQYRKCGLESSLPQYKPKCIPLQQVDNIIIDGRNIDSAENLIKHKTVASQTIYRESSAQTKQYDPDVANPDEVKDLEIYKMRKYLDGEHYPDNIDVETVERARQREAFKKYFLKIDTIDAKLKEMKYCEIFEWEEWLARERLINDCQKMRMLIVCEMFNKREAEIRETNKKKMMEKIDIADKIRKTKLKQNDIDYKRKLRKLNNKYLDKPLKYKRENITKEHIDYSSNLYGPQMRFGSNATGTHFVGVRKSFDIRIDSLDKVVQERIQDNRRLKWFNDMAQPKISKDEYFNEGKIQSIYENLRSISLNIEEILRPKVPKCVKAKLSPKIKQIEEKVKPKFIDPCEIYAAENILKVESIKPIKADESKETVIDEVIRNQLDTLKQQANHARIKKRQKDFDDIIGEYQGKKIGWMVDFLNKELKRLNELENIQAFCLIAQCERIHTENAEIKRRQMENDKRLENEKEFNQLKTMKNHVVSLYFENILKQNIDHTAESTACEVALEKAKEISSESKEDYNAYKTFHKVFRTELLNRMHETEIEYEEKKYTRLIKDNLNKYLKKIFCVPTQAEMNYELIEPILTKVLKNVLPSDDEISEIDSTNKDDGGDYEAKMAIKKVLRRIFPKNQWRHKTMACKVVEDIINDLIDDIDNDYNLYQLFREIVQTGTEDEIKNRILQAFSEKMNLKHFEETPEVSLSTISLKSAKTKFYKKNKIKSSSSYIPASESSLSSSSSSFSSTTEQSEKNDEDLESREYLKRSKPSHNKRPRQTESNLSLS